jgi:hypothetical protein
MERELLPVILILFLFLVSMVANFVLNKKIEIKYGHLIDVKIEKLHTLHLLSEEVSCRQRYLLNMLLATDNATEIDIEKQVKQSRKLSDERLVYLEILYDEQNETKLIQPLKDQYQAYDNTGTRFMELVLKGDKKKADALRVDEMRPVYESVQASLHELSDLATERAEQIAKDSTADIDFARKVILFIGLLPFGIWLVMLLWVFSYLGWQKLAGPREDDV